MTIWSDFLNARFEFDENFLEISVNPHTTIFEVCVKSEGFAGHGECETDIEDFRQFVGELEETYRLERKDARLQSIIGYETYIKFIMHKTGHVTVCGKVIDYKHSVEFEFEADQTALPPFIKRLREMLDSCGFAGR